MLGHVYCCSFATLVSGHVLLKFSKPGGVRFAITVTVGEREAADL